MSTAALQPATTPIPVQLSEPEFTAFILPYLSMPKRGPKCKLGCYRVFNLILWLLDTGMQWKCLPIPQDSTGKPVIHYTTVYKASRNGRMMGHSGRRLWPVYGIWRQRSTSTPACCMATGPTQTASKSSLHQCGNKLTVFPHLIRPDSNRIGIEK